VESAVPTVLLPLLTTTSPLRHVRITRTQRPLSRSEARPHHSKLKTILTQTTPCRPQSRTQVVTLEDNVKAFGLTYYGMADKRQGIVHVRTSFDLSVEELFANLQDKKIIGPEQGFTLPGATIVCGVSKILERSDARLMIGCRTHTHRPTGRLVLSLSASAPQK
jgi:homoaconitase/3-isopropylmalate dehydratase large subunit